MGEWNDTSGIGHFLAMRHVQSSDTAIRLAFVSLTVNNDMEETSLMPIKLTLAIVTNYMPDTFSFRSNFSLLIRTTLPITLVCNHLTVTK